MHRVLKQLGSIVGDLLYPPACPLCDALVPKRHEPCAACARSLPRLEADASLLLPGRVWVGRVRSCFAYEGQAGDALRSLKYSARLDRVRFFGRCMDEERSRLVRPDVMAVVPMHAGSVRARGFNAAAVIAQELSRICGIRLDPDLLFRTRDTKPQVGLERSERLLNVRGAFAVHPRKRARILGKAVLLIDDVLTTGATVNECARALIRAGAGEVHAITAARTL